MNINKNLEILNNSMVTMEFKQQLSFEAGRNQMSSKIDKILDSHLNTIDDNSSLESMLLEALIEYQIKTDPEIAVPIRNDVILEINYKDYFFFQNSITVDSSGKLVHQNGYPNLREYKLDLYIENAKENSLGYLKIFGESINSFDIGFLEIFRENIDTAILAFNRRFFYKEFENSTICLNAIIGDQALGILEKRFRILQELKNRLKCKEAYFITIIDGKKPILDLLTGQDLEIDKEQLHLNESDTLSVEKESYLLDFAFETIKTVDKLNISKFNNQQNPHVMCLELKLSHNKIGGAIIFIDSHEFSMPRQKIALNGITKIDDFIIMNQEMKHEREIRERIENVLIPMVGKEQANFLLDKKDFTKFSTPKARFVAILLSDMKGSTNAADSLMMERKLYDSDDPILLNKYKLYVDSINTYLGLVTEAVLSFEGVVDKYIGDAVMAEWGVPLETVDFQEISRRALLAAVFSNILTLKYNQRLEKLNVDPLFILQQRFVLHCGEALAGVYGTNLRYNYTVMGATVNETARIESLPASEVGKVTMSENFYKLVEDVIEADCVGEFQLKGKKDPIKCYHFKGFRLNDFPSFAKQYANIQRDLYSKKILSSKILSKVNIIK